MTDLKNHPAWDEFRYQYYVRLREMCLNPPIGFRVLATPTTAKKNDQAESMTYGKCECTWAANMLAKYRPVSVLDIGSYRTFVIGLAAHYKLTALDVRLREEKIKLDNETLIMSDAKEINLASNSFDAIVSLSAIEHFGLGRYGDEFDLDCDKKAFLEMKRVLKPGGHLIFTTTVTQAEPSIYFNAHRIYSYEMIESFCRGLTLIDEKYYSHEKKNLCAKEDIEKTLGEFSVYCGCWRKEQ